MTSTSSPIAPVRKSVTVNAPIADAFQVFTAGIDSWWPRSHHIGAQPLDTAVMELKPGGRLFGRSIDGVETDWGQILEWDPPHRVVFSWQITPAWQPEPDLARSSEVEIRFTPEGDATRVDLEHRHFERHGEGADTMRTSVDSPGGWAGLLRLFAERAERR